MTRIKLTHLVLSLVALTMTNIDLCHAEKPAPTPSSTDANLPDANLPAIKIDPRLLPTLLPPMSRLVTSPYGDINAIHNPLGVQQRHSNSSDVIKSVITRQEPTPATASSLEESFKAHHNSNQSRLPEVKDFTLTAPLSIHFEHPTKMESRKVGFSLAASQR